MASQPTIYPVILSGGSGSRLWPLSREQFPKQLQALTGDKTLIQETALRLGTDTAMEVAAPIVVCNDAHRFIVAEQLRDVGIEPRAVLIEPVGRNTAPAAAVAALLLEEEPDALILHLASDHLVRRPEAFRQAVATAVPVAQAGHLMSLGVVPKSAATSFGYIKQGAAIDGHNGVFRIDRFVEKPDQKTADGFLSDGGYLWNASMFLYPVGLYLEELTRFSPDIVSGCRDALDKGESDLFFFRLDPEAFAGVPSDAIDTAVMERTDKAAVVPVDMGWSDIGSWSALHGESEQDKDGNTLVGDVLALDTKDTYVRSGRQTTAVVGLEGAVVVVTDDAVLVADKAHDQQVKDVVAQLKEDGKEVATAHAKTYRPWGWFQTVDEGERFKVKRIGVKPGAKLSLQKHYHRSEHWVVVKGAAMVTNGDETFKIGENESTFIPAGTVHRLENPGKVDLEMIEVQSGEYVGEDDIVRMEDDYGRDNK